MAVEIKICGITRLEDALWATEYGANYLGFIFYEKSPRCISLQKAADIIQALGSEAPALVGVFVNESLEKIQSVQKELGLSHVQLHGDESPALVEELQEMGAYKALRLTDAAQVKSWLKMPRLLLDSSVQGVYGGAGVVADWDLASKIKREYNGFLYLAGGLNENNVESAIRQVCPNAVDVSSGVEAAPGIKDRQKLKQFIEICQK